MTLPAHIGRLNVVAFSTPVMSDARPAPRRAATRGVRSLPTAVAVATMIVGTVVAVAQTNVKRMLAYSSIAHAGYLLVALVSGNDVGKGAVLFYVLVYALSNLGAFGVVALLESRDRPHDRLEDFAGLQQRHPGLALLMTLFLLSLAGFPPLAGFVGMLNGLMWNMLGALEALHTQRASGAAN